MRSGAEFIYRAAWRIGFSAADITSAIRHLADMPTGHDDVRSRGSYGKHGQTGKRTRMTRFGCRGFYQYVVRVACDLEVFDAIAC